MSLYSKDIFITVAENLSMREVIRLESLSKSHQKMVREHVWTFEFNPFRLNIIEARLTSEILGRYCFENVNLRGFLGIAFVIDNLTSCRVLNLSHTRVTDEHLLMLKNCEVLNLSYCPNITDKGFKNLTCSDLSVVGCKQLTDNCLENLDCEIIDVTDTKISYEAVQRMPSCNAVIM